MESIRSLYKIGRGPSSSHTMGPERACKIARERYPEATAFTVTLFGSLALTGIGHGTDRIVRETLAPTPCEIIVDKESHTPVHPNTMTIEAKSGDKVLGTMKIYSIGGGSIEIEGEGKAANAPDVYPHSSFSEIAEACRRENIRLYEYVLKYEGEDIYDYLDEVWDVMKSLMFSLLQASAISLKLE